jgi:hypothetical protein
LQGDVFRTTAVLGRLLPLRFRSLRREVQAGVGAVVLEGEAVAGLGGFDLVAEREP